MGALFSEQCGTLAEAARKRGYKSSPTQHTLLQRLPYEVPENLPGNGLVAINLFDRRFHEGRDFMTITIIDERNKGWMYKTKTIGPGECLLNRKRQSPVILPYRYPMQLPTQKRG